VDEQVSKGDEALKTMLVQDLEQIAMMTGEFRISPEAREWGKAWYKNFWETASTRMDDQMLEGYAARKQTHMHKVAMIISAARSNDLLIGVEDLQLANTMLEDLEQDMPRVFSRIGRTEDSMQAERFIDFVTRKGSVPYHDAYKMIHLYFPDFRDFEGILQGCLNSGQLRMVSTAEGIMLQATTKASPAPAVKSPPKGLIITPDTVM
jgi:hypothetical protein